jgi:hypothetical protein
MIGGEFASLGAPNSMADILKHTKEGRQFIGQVQPTVMRNPLRAVRAASFLPEGVKRVMGRPADALGLQGMLQNFVNSFGLTVDGTVRDMNGEPMRIPIEDSAEEASWLLLGLPSIRQQETSATVSMMNAGRPGDAATNSSFVDRIAQGWVDVDEGNGTTADVFEEILKAKRLGLFVDDAAIKRRIEAINASKLETKWKQLPRSQR